MKISNVNRRQRNPKLFLSISLIIILIIAWPIPQLPQTGLDGSWRIAISQLVPDDYQSIPIIFTYGMWGDLIRGAFVKKNAASILLFRGGVYALYSSILIAYLYNSKNIWLAWVTFFLGSLVALMSMFMPYFQTEFELAILPLLIICFEPINRHKDKVITTLTILSGFIFFTKTSLYYYIFPVTLIYATVQTYLRGNGKLWERALKAFAKIFQCTLISIVSICLFSFIGTGHLFSNFLLLKDISSGYSAGMNESGPIAEVVFAIILSICLLISAIFIASTRSLTSSRKAMIARIMPSLYILLLSFKHAFVRHGHAPRFFIIQSFVWLALFSGLTFSHANSNEAKINRSQAMISSSLMISLLAAILIPFKYIIKGFDFYGGQFARHTRNSKAFLNNPRKENLDSAQQKSLPNHLRLTEKEKEYIGRGTIDVIPGEISIPFFYELNWMPRPTLQSYQGYTPRLDNLNASHIKLSGPEFILFHSDTIDNKHISFFSPLEYQSFVCNYRRAPLPTQEWRSPSLDLFERLDRSRCSLARQITNNTGSFHLTQHVKLPKKPGLMVLKLHIKPTWMGRIAELSLRAPKIEINVKYDRIKDQNSQEHEKTYSFSYQNAVNGLTLWPHSPQEFNDIISHCKGKHKDCRNGVHGINFTIQSNATWFFKDHFSYQIIYIEALI